MKESSVSSSHTAITRALSDGNQSEASSLIETTAVGLGSCAQTRDCQATRKGKIITRADTAEPGDTSAAARDIPSTISSSLIPKEVDQRSSALSDSTTRLPIEENKASSITINTTTTALIVLPPCPTTTATTSTASTRTLTTPLPE